MQTPPSTTNNADVIPIPAAECSFCLYLWEAQEKPTAPIIAPNFPAAPDIPWHVVLNRAGNSSAGTMKVVVFGPKLEKKKVSPHEKEPHYLDFDSANAIDEVDGEKIARNCGANGDDGLEFCDVKGLYESIFCGFREILVVNVGLKEVAAVEDDVYKKP
nr:Os06g0324601 [Ipomoea trifida]